MADTENDRLHKEVERQKQVIDALLDSNRELKQALAWCRHLLQTAESSIYANHPQPGIPPQKTEGSGEGKDGVNQTFDIASSLMDGVIQRFEDIGRQMVGVKRLSDIITPSKDGGNILPDDADTGKDGGIEPHKAASLPGDTTFALDTGTGTAAAQAILPETPMRPASKVAPRQAKTMHYGSKDVALSVASPGDVAEGKPPVDYHRLHNLLRKLIATATDGALVNTAQILMKLHEQPAQSLKNLQKLTHLSEDGISKRVKAMKKFGLIVRASGRRLLLTEKARQLLDDARHDKPE